MASKSQHLSPKTPPNQPAQSRKRHLFDHDRPNNAKKLRFSWSQSAKKSSLSLKEVPVIRCPCGRGPCSIFTSHSDKNPYRDFYTCYQRGISRQCRFFRWVDEVAAYKVPECPCGAGACSLNRDANGRWFLACRIKKGHGACGFFQWAELRTNSGLNMHHHDLIPCASPECGGFCTLHIVDDEEAFWDIVFQVVESSNLEVLNTSPCVEDEINNRDSCPIVKATESSNNQVFGTSPCVEDEINIRDSNSIVKATESSNHQVFGTSPSLEDEINNRDSYSIVKATVSSNCQVFGTLPSEEAEVPNRTRETKSLDDPNSKKICCVSYMVSQSESDHKSVSCMQICAEGDILNQDGIRHYIGLQVGGWLDRHAFPPQCIKDQPVSPFHSYDATLSGVEGSTIGASGFENSVVIIQQPPTPSKDPLFSGGVSKYHPRCQNCNTRQSDSTSLSVFKHHGQRLLKILEDKNLVDHAEMFKIAESVYKDFDSSINYLNFSAYVKKYIDCKSRLAAVESSMREGLSSQELEGIFKREAAECEASVSHFESLRGESSCGKRKLFRSLDQELEQSETKTSERKTSLFEINPEISARQRSMEAAWDEMEEALAEEIERKFLQDEARTALEMARAELPS